MEILVIKESGQLIESDSSARVHLTPFHPVVNRLKAFEQGSFNYYFKYIKTFSEEFGEEEGYISLYTLNKVRLISMKNYEISKLREKELTPEVVESLKTKTQEGEDKFFKAREEYRQSLADLGYVEYTVSDYDCDTEIYMIHPLYLDHWKEDWLKEINKFPYWAVKDIGFFATKDK